MDELVEFLKHHWQQPDDALIGVHSAFRLTGEASPLLTLGTLRSLSRDLALGNSDPSTRDTGRSGSAADLDTQPLDTRPDGSLTLLGRQQRDARAHGSWCGLDTDHEGICKPTFKTNPPLKKKGKS
jgi:hypothetical protein